MPLNLGQKVRDLQLDAVSAPRVRAPAAGVGRGGGGGMGKAEEVGGCCVFKNKP